MEVALPVASSTFGQSFSLTATRKKSHFDGHYGQAKVPYFFGLGPKGLSRRTIASCFPQKGHGDITKALEILGLQKDNCTLENIKSAFRAKVKKYHPDVNNEIEDTSTIMQNVIEAYEMLMQNITEENHIARNDVDPFDEPECAATDIFINEFLCIGKGCPYPCVSMAPHAFAYAEETGCARAISQGIGEDSLVQRAAGQCPRNCIFFVTPSQRTILEELLTSALHLAYYTIPEEAKILQGLTARAMFINNKFRGYHERKTKHSSHD
eukprot:TRINITY_DN2529_c0_g1_i2.p1 TRINITY_DN2529_c0_g1~~TRINITY_DN2529_c0_g1_i2.p1  ORF type:complete len:275 (-),score=52.34 TRINITY_DN2529_c0_g1_i2:374-1174(-)